MRKYITIIGLILLVTGISSCEDILEVTDISDRVVEIVAPKDSTTVINNTVNFTWNAVADSEAYLIQIAQPNFEEAAQIVLDSTIVQDSTFMGTRAIIILNNGDYEWRVQALNSDFQTEFSSSVFKVEANNN